MGGVGDHFYSPCLCSESGRSAPQLFRHTPRTGCDVDVSALRWGEADSRLYELKRGGGDPFQSMAAPAPPSTPPPPAATLKSQTALFYSHYSGNLHLSLTASVA